MTRLLQNYFIGNGSISMIINVNPSPADHEETINVLNNAAIISEIKINNQNKIDIGQDNNLLTSQYKRVKEENKKLKEQLHQIQQHLDTALKESEERMNSISKSYSEEIAKEKSNFNRYVTKTNELYTQISNYELQIKNYQTEIDKLKKENEMLKLGSSDKKTPLSIFKNNSKNDKKRKNDQQSSSHKQKKVSSEKQDGDLFDVSLDDKKSKQIESSIKKNDKKLFYGNASGVDLSFKGTTFDISNFKSAKLQNITPVSSVPNTQNLPFTPSPTSENLETRFSDAKNYEDEDEDSCGPRFSDCEPEKENKTTNITTPIRKRSSANVISNSPFRRESVGRVPVVENNKIEFIEIGQEEEKTPQRIKKKQGIFNFKN